LMRRFAQNWQAGHLPMMLDNVRRRRGWFTENAAPRQVANLLLAAAQFSLKHEVMRAWPVLVKVDISPLCNLRCTYCVHARPPEDKTHPLNEQHFKSDYKMPLDRFGRLVHELS